MSLPKLLLFNHSCMYAKRGGVAVYHCLDRLVLEERSKQYGKHNRTFAVQMAWLFVNKIQYLYFNTFSIIA